MKSRAGAPGSDGFGGADSAQLKRSGPFVDMSCSGTSVELRGTTSIDINKVKSKQFIHIIVVGGKRDPVFYDYKPALYHR